ncbi:MAG: hypothetical protein KGL95_06670, partial [Patescibacteria group bacterium]|nr:hypothetical protein [Patescibacteria group bacterium]
GRSIGWEISDPFGGYPILEDHDPGSTVHFGISNNFGLEKGRVLMKIIGATNDLSGNDVLYQETEELVDSKAQFSYTIPANTTNMPYQYWVKFYSLDTNSTCCTVDFRIPAYNNTIVISDLNITKNSTSNALDFRFKTTDSRGATIVPIKVYASVPLEENGTSYNAVGKVSLADYNSTWLVQGIITLPKAAQTGQQLLTVNVSTTSTRPQPLEAKIAFELNATQVKIVSATINGQILSVKPSNFESSTVLEFPFALLVLAIAITPLIFFYRKGIRN